MREQEHPNNVQILNLVISLSQIKSAYIVVAFGLSWLVRRLGLLCAHSRQMILVIPAPEAVLKCSGIVLYSQRIELEFNCNRNWIKEYKFLKKY